MNEHTHTLGRWADEEKKKKCEKEFKAWEKVSMKCLVYPKVQKSRLTSKAQIHIETETYGSFSPVKTVV